MAGASERWLSMGDDPAFTLEFDGGRPPHGWVYLEAALHRSMGNRVAMLYFDRGQGFDLCQPTLDRAPQFEELDVLTALDES